MNGTPHLTPDQLSTLAEHPAALPESRDAFAHLAQCQNCRHSLFLLSGTARPATTSAPRWLMAAAILLAIALPFGIIHDLRSRPRSPSALTAEYVNPVPGVLTALSPTPAAGKRNIVPIMFQAAYAPPRNRFVVQTTAGERWISFDTLKLFRE